MFDPQEFLIKCRAQSQAKDEHEPEEQGYDVETAVAALDSDDKAAFRRFCYQETLRYCDLHHDNDLAMFIIEGAEAISEQDNPDPDELAFMQVLSWVATAYMDRKMQEIDKGDEDE